MIVVNSSHFYRNVDIKIRFSSTWIRYFSLVVHVFISVDSSGWAVFTGILSPGLNEIFWLEVGHLIFKFGPIFRILRINLGLCLGYVQIRHVPKVLPHSDFGKVYIRSKDRT